MKSVVITQHNKDSGHDRICAWASRTTCQGLYGKGQMRYGKKWGRHIWESDFIWSLCLRGSGWRGRQGWLLLVGKENDWLLQWLKYEKNQICFPCMHAAAAKEQHSPLSQHHLFTVRDPRTGTQKSHNSRDCHPRLMTVSPQSSGHSWT